MVVMLQNQGKNAEAMVYYEMALAMQITALGPNHQSVEDNNGCFDK
jgi:hypothetical protein